MNTYQLEKLCRRDPTLSKVFIGVYASDKLPVHVHNVPCALIANTDSSDKEGSHWIGIYIDENRRGDYFDSYGRKPAIKEFENFLNDNTIQWQYNDKRLQGSLSTVCGQFVIYFLLQRCFGFSMYSIVQKFSDTDYNRNDLTVSKYVKKSFKFLTTPNENLEFIVQQICKTFNAQIN